MNEAAIVVAGLSLFVSLIAAWYARASARASQSRAEVERQRMALETESAATANLHLTEVARGQQEHIRIQNIGQSTAFDVSISYEGLLFRTLTEDDEAGIEVKPGEVVEFIPLIDWDHPKNSHHRERGGGQMGVPQWPLNLTWKDGRGLHAEKRRVERR